MKIFIDSVPVEVEIHIDSHANTLTLVTEATKTPVQAIKLYGNDLGLATGLITHASKAEVKTTKSKKSILNG